MQVGSSFEGAVRAAQYLRMSREHQRYSPENQRMAIQKYAAERGFEIVRTYQDDGRSGLTLKGREGLRQLLNDVLKGNADYSAVLVLDVSRWGRFQDADQGAHYEFLCREAGVAVHYCNEAFDNDGSTASTILKSLKRVMAAEFSRELGQKVLAGQLNGARRGFKQGGSAPFAMRRLLIDEDGKPQRILKAGQWKSLATDRVVCSPGPAHEIAAVRKIFRLFVEDRLPFREIAKRLADEGVCWEDGTVMDPNHVGRILRNPLYVGIYVFNRTSQQLKSVSRKNPPDKWIRTPIMQPMVSRRLFQAAQERLTARGRQFYSDDDLLRHLTSLLAQNPSISPLEIDRAGPPSTATYYLRFRTLARAIRLCGGKPSFPQRKRDPERGFDRAAVIIRLKAIYEEFGYISLALIDCDPELPTSAAVRKRFGGIINAYAAAGWNVDQASVRQACCRRRWARSSLEHPAGTI
jgi:DNA invertase Pin-like site-specific DNA recombinase